MVRKVRRTRVAHLRLREHKGKWKSDGGNSSTEVYFVYMKRMPRITMYMFVLRTSLGARRTSQISIKFISYFLFCPSVILADPVTSSLWSACRITWCVAFIVFFPAGFLIPRVLRRSLLLVCACLLSPQISIFFSTTFPVPVLWL
jgi:glycopeptide antibiotics resistance protein